MTSTVQGGPPFWGPPSATEELSIVEKQAASDWGYSHLLHISLHPAHFQTKAQQLFLTQLLSLCGC